jgi:hypothetical protein
VRQKQRRMPALSQRENQMTTKQLKYIHGEVSSTEHIFKVTESDILDLADVDGEVLAASLPSSEESEMDTPTPEESRADMPKPQVDDAAEEYSNDSSTKTAGVDTSASDDGVTRMPPLQNRTLWI